LASTGSAPTSAGAWLTALLGQLLLACAILAFPAPTPAQEAPAGFFTAIARDDDADVRVYLLRGVPVAARDRTGTPALVLAAAERAFKVVRTFLAIPGTDADIGNRANETALMYAALHGNLEIATLLVEKGAQVNRPGWAALHYAATGGSERMVDWLLERHAFIDAESPNRSTPLMLAVRQKHDAVARQLIAAGADPTIRNDAGLTAADYAQRNHNQPLADWLRGQAREYDARYRPAGTVRR
jgi:ankyrin repeat protein